MAAPAYVAAAGARAEAARENSSCIGSLARPVACARSEVGQNPPHHLVFICCFADGGRFWGGGGAEDEGAARGSAGGARRGEPGCNDRGGGWWLQPAMLAPSSASLPAACLAAHLPIGACLQGAPHGQVQQLEQALRAAQESKRRWKARALQVRAGLLPQPAAAALLCRHRHSQAHAASSPRLLLLLPSACYCLLLPLQAERQYSQLSGMIEHRLEEARAWSRELQRLKEQDETLAAAQLRRSQMHELEEGGTAGEGGQSMEEGEREREGQPGTPAPPAPAVVPRRNARMRKPNEG